MSRHGNFEDNQATRMRHKQPLFATRTQTISGSDIFTSASPSFQFLDGGASNRTIFLPELEPGGGQQFWIKNTGSTNNLNVVDSDGNALGTLEPSDVGLFFSSTTTWAALVVTTIVLAAPPEADYLVKTAHADLSAERVVTDNSIAGGVEWDWATAAQAKARLHASAADKMLFSTAADVWDELATTSFGRDLLALADDDALAALVDSFFLTPAEGNAAYQPLDSDLTAIAALSTTSYGRGLLALANQAALIAEVASAYQPLDSDLTALSAWGNWKLVYSDGTGVPTFVALGAADTALISNGASNAPTAQTIRKAGKETIWIQARGMWPRTTNGPAPLTRELTTGGDIMIVGWDFDSTTEEGVQFYISFPKSWDKSTITFKVYWTNAAGLTTETVSWGLSVGAYTNDDPIDSTDLGTEVRVSDTWLAQNDLHVTDESGAVTVGNTPIDDDLCICQIVRSVANDNMTGDATLLGVKIFFTTNAATDA